MQPKNYINYILLAKDFVFFILLSDRDRKKCLANFKWHGLIVKMLV